MHEDVVLYSSGKENLTDSLDIIIEGMHYLYPNDLHQEVPRSCLSIPADQVNVRPTLALEVSHKTLTIVMYPLPSPVQALIHKKLSLLQTISCKIKRKFF